MQFFAQIADGFDRIVDENDIFLESVGTQLAKDYLKNPDAVNAIAMVGWARVHGAHTFTTFFARGYADVLRIGEGSKIGGWGYGQDALRALVLVGPASRAIRHLAGQGKIAKGILAAPFDNCTWIACAQSLRLTGTRLFANVGDLVRAANIPLANSTTRVFPMLGHTQRYVDELAPALSRLGASVRFLGSHPAFESIYGVFNAALKNRNGVVVFSVRWGQYGHTLVARATAFGVHIYDRSGRVVRSLAELDDIYPGIGGAVPYGSAAIVQNTIAVRMLGPSGLLNMLALEIEPYMIKKETGTSSATQPPPPAAKNKNNRGKLQTHMTCEPPYGDSRDLKCNTYYTYTVQAGDSLSGISQKVYRSPAHWEVIYSANQAVIGNNPHDPFALKVGMELFIPTR